MLKNINHKEQKKNLKTSTLLRSLVTDMPKDKVNLGDFIRYFQHRSYGGMFFILALLCLLPGVSILAGFVLILPSLQLLMGLSSPVLPSFLGKRTINSQRLQFSCHKVIPFVEKIEQVVKPRMGFMSSSILKRVIGLLVFLLALIVAIPFPLSNYPPALALLILSLGLLEKDGLLIVFGIIFSGVALAFGFILFNVVFIAVFQLFIALSGAS